MKQLILFSSLFLTSFLGFAQKSPSANVTIDYINSRVKETFGMEVIYTDGNRYFLQSGSFGGTTKKATAFYRVGLKAKWANLEYCRKLNMQGYSHLISFDYSFKPNMILDVVDATNVAGNSPVGLIVIRYANNVVTQTFKNGYPDQKGCYIRYDNPVTTPVKKVVIPYMKQDPTAFNRIKKAIMHLKSLSDEDDPFAD